ncbi:LPS-assembly protein LptD [Pontiella desulfatans]|uniref:LPS-assembly protein LptD n=1 Tax=Pontiella desulfatans TaxID=2750659 RepID=A0A6C2U325_PONDE|nr:LPS assembly protein LptD [Pontiella desulfatans]VGO14402.1 LPS-assembly protein LptD [Pontiella desulfatans]
MPKARLIRWLLGAWGLVACAAALDMDIPKEIPDEPFDITAARIEYTNETIIASGGVTGRFENAVITADQASGNTQTGDLRLEGNIHFERDNVVWDGTELDYNYMSQTGDFGPSSLKFDPVLMSVDHVERVSTNTYLMRGATFTTCEKDHPHFHLRAKEAYLIDDEYIKAKGVTVYLGGVPVFYWPYWRHKLQKGILSFEAGISSEWGVYGMVKATVPWTPYFESITDLNLYSDRGVGVGQGFSWEHPKAIGKFAAFYLKDQDPHSKFDEASRIGQEIGDDRYRFKFEHLQRFDDTFYVNTKLNYLSDPAIIEEFFKDEYRSYAQPENYMSWVYGNSTIGTEAFANQRLNDFYDNTDRWEYSLDLYRTKIPGTPLYFQSENAIADLDRTIGTLNTNDVPYGAARLDSANTVFLPGRLGFLSLVPRAGYRATYYSETVPGGDELRNIPSAGMEVSFQANKVLSERERWYGKGLRHKIEPYADYIYQDSSAAPGELYQFDSIDTLQDENKVKLGLRNVLQTKRDNRVSRFIDLDLYTHYLIEDHGTGNDFDSLFLDARMPLTKRLMVDAEGEWDWNEGRVPFFDTRLSYNKNDIIFGLEHLYQADQKSLWTPRLDLYPNGKYSLEFYGRYNDRDDDLQEVAVIGYMNWCCMRYGLGYHLYDEDEHQIMFSVGLSAFPEAKISSGF